MKSYRGTPVSRGIVIGKVYKYSRKRTLIKTYQIDVEEVAEELKRFAEAREIAHQTLLHIKEKASRDLGESQAQIFKAYIHMLNDPVFSEKIQELISEERLNVEGAIQKALAELSEKFRRLDNDYFQERLRDIEDVLSYLLGALQGNTNNLSNLPEGSIIVAEDLTPSEIALIDKELLKGFVLKQGGMTSHTSIVARSLGIPAIINVDKRIMDEVKNGEVIILDGIRGEIYVSPEGEILERYRKKITILKKKEEELLGLSQEESITRDGQRIRLAANINSLAELDSVLRVNGDGIGLLRTEFLFLKKEHLFDEERQFKIYKKVLEKMDGRPVVIRLLDIGGDKDLPYFESPKEINPFLGWRGIRISLERQDIFKSQLRALLRASHYGDISILIPFISSIEELREVKGIIIEVKNELEQEDIPYNRQIKIGLMIEIPSTAVMAHAFAREVDFFSIGTNDLIQYTIAVDRNNSRIASLYTPFHPAVLKLIHQVVKAGQAEKIGVSICGEAAANKYLLPVFVAMGITELSMSSGYILEAKKLIRKLSREELGQVLEKVMEMNQAVEIEEYLKRYMEENLGGKNGR
ncbi:MAG: phosphoenolpyruvate--protein phosphotransferase [Halanaerobiaceae bacterium]|nr:phosphoenolpyruvate--protein phosphotransferase [Halanaerobiaceae bacterium]